MLWDGERSGLVGTGLTGTVGSTVARIRPNSALVIGKYLYHSLRSLYSRIQFMRTGTGVPHVPKNLANILNIPLPPLEEQRRIAEILDSADGAIRVEEQTIEKLAKLRAGLAADLLSGRIRTTTA